MSDSHWHLLGLAAACFGVVLYARKGQVLNRERAKGVAPQISAFLDWWDSKGTFQITIAPSGGLRTDEEQQKRFAEQGLSNAKTLADTPHGRGGAVDLWPIDFDPNARVTSAMHAKFAAIASEASAFGLSWGGRWTTSFPPTSSNPYGGDLPHLEVIGWRTELPYPPAKDGVA